MAYNPGLNLINRTDNGTFEDGEVKQEFKHFRHSLDDTYLLWRSGGSNLIIYDVANRCYDEIIPNFWMHENIVSKPIAAAASSDANRIIGLSLLSKDQTLIHYYERDGTQHNVYSQLEKKMLEPTSR